MAKKDSTKAPKRGESNANQRFRTERNKRLIAERVLRKKQKKDERLWMREKQQERAKTDPRLAAQLQETATAATVEHAAAVRERWEQWKEQKSYRQQLAAVRKQLHS